MANILIISAVFPPEPLVSAVLSSDIAERLSQNHNVVVVCPPPTRPEGFVFEEIFEPKNYNVKHLNSFTCAPPNLLGRFRESYSFGVHCVNYIKKFRHKINCIYINSWPLLAQYKIIKTAKKLNIPCSIHIQDIYPESLMNKLPLLIKRIFKAVLLPMDKYILNNAQLIFAISPSMISYLNKTRRIDNRKFMLIRNWQDESRFNLDFDKYNGKGEEDLVFMYVGSLSQSAGVSSIIKGFHEANLPGTKLIIAGNGSDKENCMEIARRLENRKIEFCEVSPQEVPQLQAGSDVLLLPMQKGISKTATPSKLTAYLFSAKPVIACVEQDSDVASIINFANCGYVVEPEDLESLINAMKLVVNMEKNELENLGRNGREYALLNFSKKANLSKIVSLIENSAEWK